MLFILLESAGIVKGVHTFMNELADYLRTFMNEFTGVDYTFMNELAGFRNTFMNILPYQRWCDDGLHGF